MKVKEFIDQLRNMPQDLELKIGTVDWIYSIPDYAIAEDKKEYVLIEIGG